MAMTMVPVPDELLDRVGEMIEDAVERALGEKPKSATDYLARGAWHEDPPGERPLFQAAVDCPVCASCGARDGFIVVVAPWVRGGTTRLGIILVKHDKVDVGTSIDVESAKQLVNRLGEAIAVAERAKGERS